jgi:hypothetical protein
VKLKLKYLITLIICTTVLLIAGIAAAQGNISIFVNGKLVKTETPAFIKDGQTFVPIRLVAEELGADVGWDQATNSVLINARDIPPPDPLNPGGPHASDDSSQAVNSLKTQASNDLIQEVNNLKKQVAEMQVSLEQAPVAVNSMRTFSSPNETNSAVNGLHIEFNHQTVVVDPGPFQDYSGSNTLSIDLSYPENAINAGETVSLQFGSPANSFSIVRWWWTLDGTQIGAIHAPAAGGGGGGIHPGRPPFMF